MGIMNFAMQMGKSFVKNNVKKIASSKILGAVINNKLKKLDAKDPSGEASAKARAIFDNVMQSSSLKEATNKVFSIFDEGVSLKGKTVKTSKKDFIQASKNNAGFSEVASVVKNVASEDEELKSELDDIISSIK